MCSSWESCMRDNLRNDFFDMTRRKRFQTACVFITTLHLPRALQRRERCDVTRSHTELSHITPEYKTQSSCYCFIRLHGKIILHSIRALTAGANTNTLQSNAGVSYITHEWFCTSQSIGYSSRHHRTLSFNKYQIHNIHCFTFTGKLTMFYILKTKQIWFMYSYFSAGNLTN